MKVLWTITKGGNGVQGTEVTYAFNLGGWGSISCNKDIPAKNSMT